MSDIDTLKNAINIFLLMAIGLSLVQEFKPQGSGGEQSLPGGEGTVPSEPVMNGTLIADLVIQVTDRYDKPVRELLSSHGFAAEIKPYEFKGNSWWINAFFNYGHIIIVYVLMGAYQKEADASRKKKILFLGVGGVLAWFFLVPQFKEQRIALKYKDNITYESPHLD